MKNIRGKRALVTGAAAGIGRGIALALASEGVNLYLLDVDAAGLASLIAEAQQLGVMAFGARCDLSEPEDISRAIRQALDQWPTIEILVNNAGVAYYGPTHSMTAAQWDRLLGINLLAPIQITRELLPMLLDCPESHILNVCSISGLVAGGRFAAYHTSKFGLIGFTEAIRAEYGRRSLGVSALCPGPVLTNLYKSCEASKSDKTVPEPPRWLCCSIDAVSKAAIHCIRANKRMKLVGPLAHFLAWAKWLAPGLLDFLNRVSRKRKQRRNELPTESGRRAA